MSWWKSQVEKYEEYLFSNIPKSGNAAVSGSSMNTSFAGCDIKVIVNLSPYSGRYDVSDGSSVISFPNENEGFDGTHYGVNLPTVPSQAVAPQSTTAAVLAELQTISVSIYRDKTPVRAFGEVHVKGFGRGPRTVAGSMIFTVFNRQVLHQLIKAKLPYHQSYDVGGASSTGAVLADQLPPFDVVVIFSNEYGNISRLALYGVEIKSEGQVMSVADLITESSVVYEAKHIDPMTPIIEMAQFLGEGGELREDFDAVTALDPRASLEERVQAAARLNLRWHNIIKSSAMRTPTISSVMDQEGLEILRRSREPWR